MTLLIYIIIALFCLLVMVWVGFIFAIFKTLRLLNRKE